MLDNDSTQPGERVRMLTLKTHQQTHMTDKRNRVGYPGHHLRPGPGFYVCHRNENDNRSSPKPAGERATPLFRMHSIVDN